MKTIPLLLFCLLLGFGSAYSAPQSSGVSAAHASNNPSKQVDQKVYSKNPEANALYIQGLEYLSKGDPRDGAAIENAHKALKLFRQATEKDPHFALAYLGQADALSGFAFNVAGGVSPIKVYRQQEAAALKAVAIDDSLVDAHLNLAEVYYDNVYDWPKTEQELKRVIQLSPNNVLAICRYARFLGTMGKFEEAEAQVKLAQTIDEKSPVPTRALMRILYWERKDDAAIAQALEALKREEDRPTRYFLGFMYLDKGEFDKGVEEIKLGSFGDADSLSALAYAYAVAGNKTELNRTLEELKHHPGRDLAFYGTAQVYVAMGDKDRALSLLEKDYERRSWRMNWLKIDPTLDPIREEPRFKALMRKMNFKQ
jgi:tetratricopeptide (TPR) repeat protein